MGTSDFFLELARAHPPEDVLERYALGHCTEAESEKVEEHILICPSCRKALDESDKWIDLMKKGLSDLDKTSTQRTNSWFRIRNWDIGPAAGIPALAGVVFALVMTGWMVWPQNTPELSEVSLSAMRGNDLRVQVPAKAEVLLKLEENNSGGGDLNGFRARIVDSSGATIWDGAVRDASIRTPKLSAGVYWVRIFGPQGDQVKEYGLLAK